MKPLLTAVLLLASAGCLSTVDEHWCGPQLPCSPGFVCTTTFHCVVAPSPDGGAGGGGGNPDGGAGVGGGSGGGGATGGGGGATGGGGGAGCGPMTCNSGCCLGTSCVPVVQQGNSACGFFGAQCRACAFNEGCVSGKCEPVIAPDAGPGPLVGTPCTQDFECGGNDGLSFCIPEFSGGQPTGFPGGYCSRSCEGQPCPQPAVCVDAETANGDVIQICLASCSATGVCRMGYQCDTQTNQQVCLPF